MTLKTRGIFVRGIFVIVPLLSPPPTSTTSTTLTYTWIDYLLGHLHCCTGRGCRSCTGSVRRRPLPASLFFVCGEYKSCLMSSFHLIVSWITPAMSLNLSLPQETLMVSCQFCQFGCLSANEVSCRQHPARFVLLFHNWSCHLNNWFSGPVVLNSTSGIAGYFSANCFGCSESSELTTFSTPFDRLNVF